MFKQKKFLIFIVFFIVSCGDNSYRSNASYTCPAGSMLANAGVTLYLADSNNYIQGEGTTECSLKDTYYCISNSCTNFDSRCCQGLTQVPDYNSGSKISIGGKCYKTSDSVIGTFGACLDCGNGICEGWENLCNCPADCKESDYATIDEYCNEEYSPLH